MDSKTKQRILLGILFLVSILAFPQLSLQCDDEPPKSPSPPHKKPPRPPPPVHLPPPPPVPSQPPPPVPSPPPPPVHLPPPAPVPSPPPPHVPSKLEYAYYALQAWKRAITCDPMGLTSNWYGTNVCNYTGIYCAPAPYDPSVLTVAAIDLNHGGLCGTLPRHLKYLTDVAVFHINSNHFTGSVPCGLGKDYLYEFDASNNELGPEFPYQIVDVRSLAYFDIRFNKFSSLIPEALFTSDVIDVILLNNNDFNTSSLPARNFAHTQASILVFANLNLEGCCLTQGWGDMANTLRELVALNAGLNGCLLDTVGSLEKLEVFDVSYNRLQGPLPDDMGGMKNLEVLNVAHNHLTGSIPEGICNLPKLKNFTYDHNYFCEIPNSCLKIPKQSASKNCLPGLRYQLETKDCYGTEGLCSQSYICKPSSDEGNGCSFPVAIPPSPPPPSPPPPSPPPPSPPPPSPPVPILPPPVPTLPPPVPTLPPPVPTLPPPPNQKLQTAFLAFEAWSKTITCDPNNVAASWKGPDVCSYKGVHCVPAPNDPNALTVASVDLNSANICGSLPEELGFLSDLALFHINSNSFQGTFPESFYNMKYLYELDISNNNLVGPFPEVVLQIETLSYLDLRYNKFYGQVPPSLFQMEWLDVILINNNDFEFTIPETIADSEVSVLVMANLNIQGCLPRSIGNMSNTLYELNLMHNDLNSCLPPEIGLLEKLTVFDVSYNHLGGQLPETMGQMVSLKQLNIAHNRFSGEIPYGICLLPHLENFTYAYNYFSGEPASCFNVTGRDGKGNCLPELESPQKPVDQCSAFNSYPVLCEAQGECVLAVPQPIPPVPPPVPPPTPPPYYPVSLPPSPATA